jgi:hypothetical protein
MKSKARPPTKETGPPASPTEHHHISGPGQALVVLERLHRIWRSKRGFVARCPAHDDRFPSLSITEGRDGRVLLYCFGGCDTEAVVSAIGLTMSDLFPDDPRRLSSPRPRRQLYPVPRRVALGLSAQPQFAYEWELAKILAGVPEPLAQRDVLLSWDFLVERVNLPLIITLSRAAREVGT